MTPFGPGQPQSGGPVGPATGQMPLSYDILPPGVASGAPVLAGPSAAPEYATPGLAWAAAPPPPTSVAWKRVLLLVSIVAGIGISGLALIIIVGVNIGVVPLIVGIVTALLPVPILVYVFLWLDRYDPEPVKYLLFCFAWGAFVATTFAYFANTGAAILLDRNGLSENLVAVLVAPFVEESMKALGPVLLFWRRRKAFSGMIDAIVYCGLSATGFAFVENILYLGGASYAKGAEEGGALVGAQQTVITFFARIMMSGFAHPLFTAMTAIGLGIAARAADRRIRWIAPLGGLVAAMMLHGSWNLMSTLVQETQEPVIFLYGYFAVMMPIFLGMVGYALWLRAAEGRLVVKTLPAYVRSGWLSPPEVASLGTVGRRLAARRWAKRMAGDAGAKAMSAYQFDLTRLALLRDGIHRGLGIGPAEIAATLAEERQLLDAVVAYRHVFAGRDPQVPRAVWDGQVYHITFPDGVVRALAEPEQPVVPVPVRLAPPPPPPGYGYPAMGYR